MGKIKKDRKSFLYKILFFLAFIVFGNNFAATPTIQSTEYSLGVAFNDMYWFLDGIFITASATFATSCPISRINVGHGIRFTNIGGLFLTLGSDLWLGEGAVIDTNNAGTVVGTLATMILDGNCGLYKAGGGSASTYFRNVTMDGNGYSFDFNGQYLSYDSLSLKNIILKNLIGTGSSASIQSWPGYSSSVFLENIAMELSGTFDFFYDGGNSPSPIIIRGDVVVKGCGNQINILSPIVVMPYARLYFDKNTTVNISDPGATIVLSDPTSSVYFDGCSVNFTSTGLTFTSGTVYFDNRVKLNSSGGYAIQFRAASTAKFLSGVRVDVLGSCGVKF